MSVFTRAEAIKGLGRQLTGSLSRQQTVPGHRDTGGVIRADWGTDDPGGAAGLAALALWLHLMRRRFPDLAPSEPADAALLPRVLLALDYLERVQRPSGLTDLRDCNYDSSPDAGFILQAICPPLLLAAAGDPLPAPEWAEPFTRLSAFARRMAEGARKGGFHTPNHRWVISGALALASRLFPDLDAAPTIDAYLAEGIDLDEDGFYIERSAGMYDAVCARSLLLLAEDDRFTPLREAVARNLRADLYLLNADGTIETGLSRRQDSGTVPLATSLAAPYLWASFLPPRNDSEASSLFRAAAEALWEATPPERRDYYSLSQVLVRFGEPEGTADPGLLPSSFARHFPANGLWRVRRGPLSASFFRDVPRLFNFRFGQAYLAGVSIHQSYFGVGQFLADDLEVTGEGVRLVSHGERSPYRPGYEQPLGRPVPPREYSEARVERALRRVPPAASEITAHEIEDGFQLHLRTRDGLDRATVQIAFDFPPGGVWETGDTCLRPEPGQVLFLKGGSGTMWYGNDAVRIGPGAHAHRMWRMRDAEPPGAPELVRVLMTFETPVDHAFTVTGGRWPWPNP
jgi:hypothetical protein